MNARNAYLLVACTAAFAGCASVDVPALPRSGPIAAPDGGVAGYQHGVVGSRFVVGAEAHDAVANGYVKRVGADGTIAVRRVNGAVFAVPNALAPATAVAPYGAGPVAHDAFVKDYFTGLGLEARQIGSVDTMTMLESQGRSDEDVPTVPRVTAWFSVIRRQVDGVAVPDSFAWARVAVDGRIVQEAVYWPALPAQVIADVRRFRSMLADDGQRRAFEARVGAAESVTTLTIRHAAATEDRFETFASLDVTRRAGARDQTAYGLRAPTGRSLDTASVTRHFDIDGHERFLPQERLRLDDRYPVDKQSPSANAASATMTR